MKFREIMIGDLFKIKGAIYPTAVYQKTTRHDAKCVQHDRSDNPGNNTPMGTRLVDIDPHTVVVHVPPTPSEPRYKWEKDSRFLRAVEDSQYAECHNSDIIARLYEGYQMAEMHRSEVSVKCDEMTESLLKRRNEINKECIAKFHELCDKKDDMNTITAAAMTMDSEKTRNERELIEAFRQQWYDMGSAILKGMKL